jgi:8-oxo-dGTP pyrophosphatase MutT (NUDIX family)
MIRDAATLILFKHEENGPRVLMGLRNAGHKFMPNRMVFPGGGVDAEDFHAPVASPLPAHVLARLQRSATPELAAALGVAVARELEEEAGLSLGTPPELSGLDYLCRAVTPDVVTIRFNARFFVAPASVAGGDIGGSGELEGLDWYSLDALLQLKLSRVTRQVLLQLQLWLDLDAADRAARNVPLYLSPNWVEE